MRYPLLVLILCFTVPFFATCGPCSSGVKISLNVTDRSGPVNDDYVEEPLSERSAKYAHALEVSNATVEQLRDGKTHDVYEGRLSESLRKSTTEEKFEEALRPLSTYGPVREYKPMQWSFASRFENGREVLYSTKLVEHEKGRLRYIFVFANDGKFEKLIGFHWRPWTGVHTPGQL